MDFKLADVIIEAYKKGRADAQVDNFREKYLVHNPVSSLGCEFCANTAYISESFTVITQLGKEMTGVFNYCPNCGRKLKMKGEKL